MKTKNNIPSPEDSWAQVELFRWQYGSLPEPEDFRPVEVPIAVRNMADALMSGDQKEMPSVFNVAYVMRYLANVVEKKPINFINHCDQSAINALNYLAETGDVPTGGELIYNREHLQQIATELKNSIKE